VFGRRAVQDVVEHCLGRGGAQLLLLLLLLTWCLVRVVHVVVRVRVVRVEVLMIPAKEKREERMRKMAFVKKGCAIEGCEGGVCVLCSQGRGRERRVGSIM